MILNTNGSLKKKIKNKKPTANKRLTVILVF